MEQQPPPLADQAELDQLRQHNRLLMQQNAALQAQLRRAQRVTNIPARLTEVPTLNLAALQIQMLRLLHEDLGYERAILASYDAQDELLTGWRCSCHPSGEVRCIAEEQQLPLRPARGLIAEAVVAGQPQLITAAQSQVDIAPPPIVPLLQQYAVVPLVIGGALLGVLLVDNPASQRALSEEDRALLTLVARDMAVVLLGVQRAIDRAHHTLSEAERSRSIDHLHETLVQPLYGLSYAFEATLRMVPEHDTALQAQMRYLQAHVQTAKSAIQGALFDFWPDQLDAERLAAELQSQARALAPQLVPQITIDPHYDVLPLDARQQLFQIARHALSSVIEQSTSQATVHLDWSPTQLQLVVTAEGSQLSPAELLPTTETDPWSLRGRVAALGGQLELTGQAGAALGLCVTLPAGW